jgi:hypothetical protein
LEFSGWRILVRRFLCLSENSENTEKDRPMMHRMGDSLLAVLNGPDIGAENV